LASKGVIVMAVPLFAMTHNPFRDAPAGWARCRRRLPHRENEAALRLSVSCTRRGRASHTMLPSTATSSTVTPANCGKSPSISCDMHASHPGRERPAPRARHTDQPDHVISARAENRVDSSTPRPPSSTTTPHTPAPLAIPAAQAGGPAHPGIDIDATGRSRYVPPAYVSALAPVPERRTLAPLRLFLVCGWSTLAALTGTAASAAAIYRAAGTTLLICNFAALAVLMPSRLLPVPWGVRT